MSRSKIKSYRYYTLKRRHWPQTVIIIFLLAAVAGGAWFWQRPDKQVAQQTNQQTQTAPKPPAPVLVEGRYLFSGTIVLARAVERGALVGGKYDYSQPFSGLASFEPEKYDGWLADLECPVTTNNVSYEQQVQRLVFNCRPEWLPEFSKYFKFVNLANNHTGDMGTEGFVETQKHLEQAGVQTVGNYRPSVTKDNCEVMGLPVRVKDSAGAETKATLPVAVCAFHYFSFRPAPGEMEAIERYAKVMPVFGLMHVGVEYLPAGGTDQVNIAHKMIDLGSDFVIGNSPHWVQNSEAYKGKLIAYSTGNFIFDQIDYETQRGLSIDTTFQIEYNDNLKKWLELGEQCKPRGDTCLEQAEKLGLSKLKLKYSHAPVASLGGNRKITKKGDLVLQKSVEERLDWVKTLQGLTQ